MGLPKVSTAVQCYDFHIFLNWEPSLVVLVVNFQELRFSFVTTLKQ